MCVLTLNLYERKSKALNNQFNNKSFLRAPSPHPSGTLNLAAAPSFNRKAKFFSFFGGNSYRTFPQKKKCIRKKRNECHRDGFFPLRRKFTRTRCVRLKGKKNCNIKGRKAYFCLLPLSLYPAQRFKRRIPEPLHSGSRRKKGGRIFAKTSLSFSPDSCAHFIRGPGGSLAPHPVSPVQKFFFNVDLFDRNVTWNTQCQEKLAKLTRVFSFC